MLTIIPKQERLSTIISPFQIFQKEQSVQNKLVNNYYKEKLKKKQQQQKQKQQSITYTIEDIIYIYVVNERYPIYIYIYIYPGKFKVPTENSFINFK